MSNPDPYGPYWRDQDDAGYGSGRRSGPDPASRQQSAWDDGGGFWRDDRSPGRAGRDAGRAGRDGRASHHRAAEHRDSQSPARGSRRDPQLGDAWGSHRNSGRSAGRGRSADSDDRSDWTGRLSQTADDLRSKADDLRNRLSSRTRSAASRVSDRVQARRRGAGEQGTGYGAASAMGGNGAFEGSRGAGGRGVAGSVDDQLWSGSGSSRVARRAAHAGGNGRGGYGPGDYGPGDYGPGDYGSDGYGGRRAAGRTAMRQPAGDLWDDPDRTSRGVRTRIADRRFGQGGGNGRGGGGHGGGRYGGPRGRGGGFKNWLLYGRWWRHWTLKKALAVMGAGIAAVILLGIGAFFIMYETTPIPKPSQFANLQSSTVYFANGSPMGTFDQSQGGLTIDRILLTQAQIPTLMTKAMVAAEDRHFYTEGGVSFTGLLRSAYDDLKGSGNLQGGSTITMQYAKNYYAGVNTGQNLSTKLKEIFIAMKLAHKETKQWVMTSYLNTVPFGSTVDGLGAAAESYFNIDLTKPHATLTLAQAALLAALPNNPAVFSGVLLSPKPQADPLYPTLYNRFKYVLTNMWRDGDISQAQIAGTKFPKITPPASGNGQTGYTGYLMNMVEQQLEAPKADGGYNLSQQAIDTGGYRIKTTFSMAKVKALARAVNSEKAAMKQAAALSGGVYVKFRNYDRIGAVLEDPNTGAILAVYGGPGYGLSPKRCALSSCDINMAEEAEPVGSSFKPYVLSAAVNEGMNVVTSKLNGFSPIWIPLSSSVASPAATQVALSSTSPPPGCSAPTPNQQGGNCRSSNGTEYFLFNETGENLHKPLAVNEAAAISSDPAFEDLAHRDGIQAVINMAKNFGVGQNAFVEPCPASAAASTSKDPMAATIAACNDLTGPGFKSGKNWYPGHGLENNFSPSSNDKGGQAAGTPGSPAIALGENPLTPIEQASTFATLADDGVYHTPHVVASIQQNGTPLASPLRTRTVLPQAQAADVAWALSFDNTFSQGNETGTALGTVPFGHGYVIGKTGTLGTGANASQAWFIGGTRKLYAMSVALFTNLPGQENLDNLPQANGTPGSQGGGWPASIWNAYFQKNVNPAHLQQLLPQQPANFQRWIRVKAQAPKKKFCQQGGGQGFGGFGGQGGGNQQCVCPKHAQNCGQNPNPNPGPSCHGNGNGNGNGGNCGPSSTPNPTPSCGIAGFGGQCSSSPAPSITPSTSPTVSPSPSCSTGPGGKCHVVTTSYLRSSPGSGSSPGSAASFLTLAAEKEATRLAALLGLII